MRHSILTLVPVGFAAAIAVLMPVASCTGGVRNNRNGTCPSGATCSPDTPNGLHFIGLQIGDGFFDFQQVKITAQGGTQTVHLEVGDDTGPRTPFTLPYTASVDGGAATVVRQTESALVLRGVASDVAQLQIEDPAGRLYDRIAITSRPLARTQLGRMFSDWVASVPENGAALYAPGSTGYISLRGSDDSPVVDDSMQLTGDGITQTGWDEFTVGQLAAGVHDVTVAAAGQTHKVQVEVAPAPDRVELPIGPESLVVGAQSVICGMAFLVGRHIHVAWTYSAVNATVSPLSLGCAGITAKEPGTVTVRASAGGLTVERDIPSVKASRSARAASGIDELRATAVRRWPAVITFGDTAGERAAMQ